jgi:hypothetical protein
MHPRRLLSEYGKAQPALAPWVWAWISADEIRVCDTGDSALTVVNASPISRS